MIPMRQPNHQPRIKSACAALLVAALAAPWPGPAAAADVAAIELVDQHGAPDSLAAHAGEAVTA